MILPAPSALPPSRQPEAPPAVVASEPDLGSCPAIVITTSWDDGHPQDLRLAELLEAYQIPATFYIPKANPLDDLPVMSEAEIRGLSRRGFEIGAHTMDHVVLTRASDAVVRRELAESKAWVEGLTGGPCSVFSPPNGKFAARHVDMIREAGFAGFRTTEMWSLDRPRPRHDGLLELPTTLQAQAQPMSGTLRNLMKRCAVGNTVKFLRFGRGSRWMDHAEAVLDHVLAEGRGVFHLWGHSWELEEADQWGRLERVLARMRSVSRRAALLNNSELCTGRSLTAFRGAVRGADPGAGAGRGDLAPRRAAARPGLPAGVDASCGTAPGRRWPTTGRARGPVHG